MKRAAYALRLAVVGLLLGSGVARGATTACGIVDAASAAAPLVISVDVPAGDHDAIGRAACADRGTALAGVHVQVDGRALAPALNASAAPTLVPPGGSVRFGSYANYRHWIRRAELRLFAPAVHGAHPDLRGAPLRVLPVELGTPLEWRPDAGLPEDLVYVLRVYDAEGRHDETAPKPLTLARGPVGEGTAVRTAPAASGLPLGVRPGAHAPASAFPVGADAELLAAYGESGLAVRNIPVSGAAVTVSGRGLAPGSTVRVFDAAVPVDAQGDFAVRQLLPPGAHAVAVELDGEAPRRIVREVAIPRGEWFHVVQAELTLAGTRTDGPTVLAAPAEGDGTYDDVTGRGAFYVQGRVNGDTRITLSADTRERRVEDLFSNFASKDPRYLLERIDPERSYPVYGDDGTVTWDAPTNGRAYARVERGESRFVWGNFQSAWNGLEFNAYSRALYGANLLWKSEATTATGERRVSQELFVAEPGTLDSREEFRATGGSLYYLRRQDLTRGSERIWVEVRDETSGIALDRRLLAPGLDYEISWLQGRVLLQAPLASTVDAGTPFRTGSVSGNPVYLVVAYEYSPGLQDAGGNAYGLRHSSWLNEHVRLGASGYQQGDSTDRRRVGGLDATLRFKPGTYLELEGARSTGAAAEYGSFDGGFGFASSAVDGERAEARRVHAAVDLAELDADWRGRASAYWRERDAGYAGPGALAVGGGIVQQGATLALPLDERTTLDLRWDERDARLDRAESQELALARRLGEPWTLSLGARRDERANLRADVGGLAGQDGLRTDAIFRLDYRPAEAWGAYAFLQDTVERDAGRDPNDRYGIGGDRRLTERLRVRAELSDGDGGTGGRLGGDWQVDDRANVYLTHAVETERPDSSWRGRFGDTVLGSRVKLGDRTAVYDEVRRARGAGPDSLTNAFGVELAPGDRWTWTAKFEYGTLVDPLAGDLDRRALALGAGYRVDGFKATSNVEWREETGVGGDRRTWLLRNTAGLQLDPDWRLLVKANGSFSTASRGNFYDGDFVDAALGAAYRPVGHDRGTALLQYRYFHTLPSPGQVAIDDVALDYAQRSHVLSVDGTRALGPRLSLGLKYGLRLGELRDSRLGGPWYSSRADLAIVRADLRWIRRWDLLLEARQLDVREAESTRRGVLAAVYRQLGEHVRLGVGWNFTDFSDDLTELSYRSRGPFVNLAGSF